MSSGSVRSQPASSLASQSVFSRPQLTVLAQAPAAQPAEDAQPASETPIRAANNKKDSGPSASLLSGASDSGVGGVLTARERQQETVAIPVDVIAPPSPLRPRLSDYSGATATQQAQLRAEHPLPRPAAEAALTVVIRNADSTGTTQEGDSQGSVPATAPQAAGNSGSAAASSTDSPQPTAGEMIAAVGSQYASVSETLAPADPALAGALPPSTETERRRTARGAIETGVNADISPGSPSQPGTMQSFPVKAEVAKAAEFSPPRSDAPQLPAAVREPLSADKDPGKPLQSISLEFTPDGSRDVRVRLSERAGEVHVSLHSTDPSITKNLRDGVSDLAGVLANAGYDAQTWTSGRQQQENPQQESAPQRRNPGSSATGAESFDGVIQNSEPIRENL
jgi:hypothetical protein